MKISLCVITCNEQKNLRRCLESARLLVDEIIVVDSGSIDGTREVAREFSATWEHKDWRGYAAQKNYALSKASYDWVLSMDADEAISQHLLSELLCWKTQNKIPPEYVGFSMPRCTYYEGRWIRNGDWYPDRLVRLFRKDQAHFEGGKVHERLASNGFINKLFGDLEHYSYSSRIDHIERAELYSELWADSKFEEGVKVFPGEGVSRSIFKFAKSFLFRFGFMDGWQGLQISLISSFETYKKYKKLCAKIKGKNSDNRAQRSS